MVGAEGPVQGAVGNAAGVVLEEVVVPSARVEGKHVESPAWPYGHSAGDDRGCIVRLPVVGFEQDFDVDFSADHHGRGPVADTDAKITSLDGR